MDHVALMADWQSGNSDAGNAVVGDIYRELEAIANAKLSREMRSSLSTGDLVHEAMVRISKLEHMAFKSRAHILSLTSRVMHQVLVDQARRRNADKRYHTKVTLNADVGEWEMPIEILALDMRLRELRDIDPERADIVEMRFFGGMSLDDISSVLDISVNTVKRRWQASRIWLHDRLRH